MKTITVESESEDMDIRIHRIGRRLIVSAPRAGVARAIERKLIKAYMGEDEKEPLIGFQTD